MTINSNTEFSQISLPIFEPAAIVKDFKRKKKVEETFARIRQLHDELSTQL